MRTFLHADDSIEFLDVEVEGGGAYLFVACLSNLIIDHASLSRRRTVPILFPVEVAPRTLVEVRLTDD